MTRAHTRLILTAIATVTALGCAPQPQQARTEVRVNEPAAARPPEVRSTAGPKARRGDLPHATMPDGTVLALELALTPEEISQGLMFRPSLAEDSGMLFIFPEPRYPSFWMLNTFIPLDLVFLDASGNVVHVHENARPCPAEPCPRYVPDEPAKAVLEINAGAAARFGLSEGARVRVDNVNGFPAPAAGR